MLFVTKDELEDMDFSLNFQTSRVYGPLFSQGQRLENRDISDERYEHCLSIDTIVDCRLSVLVK